MERSPGSNRWLNEVACFRRSNTNAGRSLVTSGRNSRLIPSDPAKLVKVPHSWTMNLFESEPPAKAGDTARTIRSATIEKTRIIHLLVDAQEAVDAAWRVNSAIF